MSHLSHLSHLSHRGSSIWCLSAIAIVAPCVGGCGSQKPEGDLAGSVTFQGQPVAQGEIQFSSQDTGVGATAMIVDGTFAIDQKLPVGTYQVAIVPPMMAPDPTKPVAPQGTKTDLPRKVQDPNSSGLQVVLGPGSNQVELQVPE